MLSFSFRVNVGRSTVLFPASHVPIILNEYQNDEGKQALIFNVTNDVLYFFHIKLILLEKIF